MCDAGTGSRVTSFACGSISSIIAMPCAIVFAVPPVSWMLNVRSSGPSLQLLGAEQRADLVRLAAQADDQHAGEVRVPRVAAERAAQQLSCPRRACPCRSREPCVSATTPSTFGNAASRSRVKCSAMPRATVAEQFTVDRMPM